jgi:acetyl/propionyl-CoA carboxylase alpha subunit/acetyl-CoA carboxylase carboxyltransferase component
LGRSFGRIAILNRGEAATRCLRAIRELRTEDGSDLIGIALYTDPDRLAPFVREADEAVSLGPALRGMPGAERPAYLDRDRVMAALRAMRADAVWPGWGFLAEAPDFVERLEQAGLCFLGPSAEVMRRLGDKMASKRIAEAAQVPVLPWSGGPIDREGLLATARSLGFPVLLKASAGGGGRGIRTVHREEDLAAAFVQATSEAEHSFGDGTLFLEAFAPRARHVEVQMAADAFGTVLAVGTRDCSVQRRHQKVVEEGPPPGLSDDVVQEMRECSIRLLRKAGYLGLATCEYLVTEDRRFYFLEVNPRLQVEHGVTEVLTGVDLVKWQIRIARGEKLASEAPPERGHAIEVRVCAEDPARGFAPSPGRIPVLELPAGPGVRVDCGVAPGGEIPAAFDSMIAKVIAHGATREEARTRLVRALQDLRLVVEGGMVNKGFLIDVLGAPAFIEAECDTGWLDRARIAREPEPRIEALLVAAILTYQRERAAVLANFFDKARGGRPRQIPASTGADIDLVYGGRPYRLKVYATGGWAYRVHLDERVAEMRLLEQGPFLRQLITGDSRHDVLFSESNVEYRIELDGRLHRVQCDLGGRVRAPAPALVIEIDVAPGDAVQAGDPLGMLEAMKTETAFFAPLSGTVREVLVRPGERVSGGDVLLVIEPTGESQTDARSPRLELPQADDPLAPLFDAEGAPDLRAASGQPAGVLAECVRALRSELRRILLGYDVNPERADRLIRVLEAPVEGISPGFRGELAQLARAAEIFVDVESLFSRVPSRLEDGELGPSADSRMTMYLRRMEAEGAGIEPTFLGQLQRTLAHYEIATLVPDEALRRATLRLFATRTTFELRSRLLIALVSHTMRLAEVGETFARFPTLEDTLDRLAGLRASIERAVADIAARARFAIFERPRRELEGGPRPPVDLETTVVPPPDPERLRARAEELGLSLEQARRIELWRLESFELDRIQTYESEGIFAFHGRARDRSGDERLLVFAEVLDLGAGVPTDPDPRVFELSFLAAVEAMRAIQREWDPEYRLQWNRLTVFIRPPIVLTERLLGDTVRRLAPETGHLGLERVVVRIARLDPAALAEPPRTVEVLAGNPTGGRVESWLRLPHRRPLAPATRYERRVAASRARGLVYPYEIVRLFVAEPARAEPGPGAPTGPGEFQEYDLREGRAEPVRRNPGGNTCGVVIGTLTTPTVKYPEGMRRVAILSDPSFGMGALSAPECDRIVAAIDLAEREELPVEWVSVSSGARIAMDSGTENLDATARVVRRLVTFTDAGGEVNLVLPGVNVGAQSYFDALATMGLDTRGILIMLPASSMVLTGRAALEFSGGVSAEDEVGIGGFERIMGPNGEAHIRARDLGDAYRLLLDHYGASYRAPGEPAPRLFATEDPRDRDVRESLYEGDEGFSTIGDLFSDEHNPDRKRPFAMRPLMRALADQDGIGIERWKDWVGAETAIVWDAHLGGHPITLIGIESRSIPRQGHVPPDGPESWTAATLFPLSSKKVARAINAASGLRPCVVLANLSGFDGSPESMRRGVLEFGAEIARAVVRFRGPLLFAVVSRYHGGAYVVFSRELNPEMRAIALRGSFASVIGGPAAAAVIFPREVRRRALDDPRVREARARSEQVREPAERARRRAEADRVLEQVLLESRALVAAEFDAVHTVERALEVGSLEALLDVSELRPALIAYLDEAAAGGTNSSRSPSGENRR